MVVWILVLFREISKIRVGAPYGKTWIYYYLSGDSVQCINWVHLSWRSYLHSIGDKNTCYKNEKAICVLTLGHNHWILVGDMLIY